MWSRGLLPCSKLSNTLALVLKHEQPIEILVFKTVWLSRDRRRLTVRITELEDSCEQLRVRNSSLEKAKGKLANEIKELTIELENVGLNYTHTQTYIFL